LSKNQHVKLRFSSKNGLVHLFCTLNTELVTEKWMLVSQLASTAHIERGNTFLHCNGISLYTLFIYMCGYKVSNFIDCLQDSYKLCNFAPQEIMGG